MSRLEFVNGHITNSISAVDNTLTIDLGAITDGRNILESCTMKYDRKFFQYLITSNKDARTLIDMGYNGYVVFPRSYFPDKPTEYIDLLNHVSVHGGVTYFGLTDNWAIFGFDTAHFYSKNYPYKDKAWIRNEIKQMLLGVFRISQLNESYLQAIKSNLTSVQETIEKNVSDTDNYGAVIVKNQ